MYICFMFYCRLYQSDVEKTEEHKQTKKLHKIKQIPSGCVLYENSVLQVFYPVDDKMCCEPCRRLWNWALLTRRRTWWSSTLTILPLWTVNRSSSASPIRSTSFGWVFILQRLWGLSTEQPLVHIDIWRRGCDLRCDDAGTDMTEEEQLQHQQFSRDRLRFRSTLQLCVYLSYTYFIW